LFAFWFLGFDGVGGCGVERGRGEWEGGKEGGREARVVVVLGGAAEWRWKVEAEREKKETHTTNTHTL